MKRLNIKRLLLVATLLTSACAYGNEYSKSYEACMQQAFSTLDMVTCISNEYERQDQRLNENVLGRTHISMTRKHGNSSGS